MKIADLLTREFEVVHEETTLLEAMRHLRECPLVADEIGIKCVLVIDSADRLVGLLTQSDAVGEILFPYFVRSLANTTDEEPRFREEDFHALGAWAGRVKVRDIMSRDVVQLGPDADLFEAANAMVAKKVKSIPVVDGGTILGIVYRSSLYRQIAESILNSAVA